MSKPVQGLKKRVATWIWLVVCVLIAVGFSVATWALFQAGDSPAPESYTVPAPRMVVLTDVAGVNVSYDVSYHAGSSTSGTTTHFNDDPTQSLPTGTREIHLYFSVPASSGTGVPQQIRWAILLNSDARMYAAKNINSHFDSIQSTVPGSGISAPACSDVQTFPTNQVLTGTSTIDPSTRQGEIDIAGGVPDDVTYVKNGTRTAVNVLGIVAGIQGSGTSANTTCDVSLYTWEQVGGITWHTPVFSGGQIRVGRVPENSYVEIANPPLTDSQSLAWSFIGAPAVSYTLFDTNVSSSHEWHVFLAGAAAAIAGAVLIELAKTLLELLTRPEPSETRVEMTAFPGDAARPGPPSQVLFLDTRGPAWSPLWFSWIGFAAGLTARWGGKLWRLLRRR